MDIIQIADPLFEVEYPPRPCETITTIRTGTTSPRPLPPPAQPQPAAPPPPAAPPAAPIAKPQCLVLPAAAARQLRRIAAQLQPAEREAITALLADYTLADYKRVLEITAASSRVSRPRTYLRRILDAHPPIQSEVISC